MFDLIVKPPITSRQKKAALAVAGAIDFLQIVFLPALLPGYAVDTALDILAAIILTVICGFKWQFALAFTMELFPIVDIFPTWTAVVLMLGATTPTAPPKVHVSSTNGSAPPPQPAHASAFRDADVVDVEAVRVPPIRPPQLPH